MGSLLATILASTLAIASPATPNSCQNIENRWNALDTQKIAAIDKYRRAGDAWDGACNGAIAQWELVRERKEQFVSSIATPQTKEKTQYAAASFFQMYGAFRSAVQTQCTHARRDPRTIADVQAAFNALKEPYAALNQEMAQCMTDVYGK